MSDAVKNAVEHVSVSDAIALLNRSERDGQQIKHVISVIRDPNDTSRILAINAVEA